MKRFSSVPLRLALPVAAAVFALACRTDDPPPAAPSASAKARPAPPVDRLAPGELAPGTVDVFGFPVPRELAVVSRTRDAALLIGEATPDAVYRYVRTHVDVSHLEVAGSRLVFPKARIKKGARDRIYRFVVAPDGARTKLSIEDITPPPVVKGLSEAERWRRAGFSPDGKPLDPKALE